VRNVPKGYDNNRFYQFNINDLKYGYRRFAYYSAFARAYDIVLRKDRYNKPSNNPAASDAERSWCNGDPSDKSGSDRFALTVKKGDFNDFVMLCPAAFTSDKAGKWNSLAEIQNKDQTKEMISDMTVKGLTLLHEMIHLIEGVDETPDVTCKSFLFLNCSIAQLTFH
jgi:hypothetical protein